MSTLTKKLLLLVWIALMIFAISLLLNNQHAARLEQARATQPWLCSWVQQHPEPPADKNPCR